MKHLMDRQLSNLQTIKLLARRNMNCKTIRVEFSDGFSMGDWGVACHGKTFIVNNHGMKLAARYDEELNRISFDIEHKIISISVKNPTIDKAPRIVDLSNAAEFFEELRNDIEKVLIEIGSSQSVTPNEDRTIFEIS